MRASRLVSLMLLLQTRGRMTAPEIASRLEVSVRTVYRDLAALSAAGVPVYAEPGRNGGVQFVQGYRTRLTGLTAEEAEALFMSGVSGPLAQLGFGTVLAAAQLKVLATLPPELRGRAARVQERFLLDAPTWFREIDDVPLLADVATALWDDRRIDVRYRRPDRTVRRVLDPLGLVVKGGIWYLVARAGGGPVRTYRASRLVSVDARAERFERPDGFDLAARWAEAAGSFEEQMLRVDVAARLSPAGMARLRHAVEPPAWRAAVASAGPPDADGWVSVVIPQETVDIAHGALLRLGADIEVLEPVALRRRMADTGRALVARYA